MSYFKYTNNWRHEHNGGKTVTPYVRWIRIHLAKIQFNGSQIGELEKRQFSEKYKFIELTSIFLKQPWKLLKNSIDGNDTTKHNCRIYLWENGSSCNSMAESIVWSSVLYYSFEIILKLLETPHTAYVTHIHIQMQMHAIDYPFQSLPY